ncbi:hypothetical protein NQZ68_028878 [Dissostichus eleginoides]|nr:hypothetical protein NQZ68_028878 [Dissostichus eleginoides]
MKALVTRCEGLHACNQFLDTAQVANRADTLPLSQCRTAMWAALRHHYPSPCNLRALKDLTKTPTESMHDYLKRAGEGVGRQYRGATRQLTGNHGVMERLSHIKALPKPVQTALEDVVNLETQPFHDWKQTVTHWYTRHQRKMDQEDDEVKILTKRLLKAQIAEKDNETNKKKAKAVPQMSAMSTPKTTPSCLTLEPLHHVSMIWD